MKRSLVFTVVLMVVASACLTDQGLWQTCDTGGDPWGTDGYWVLYCDNGEWIPTMTAQEFVDAAKGDAVTIGPLPTKPVPATTEAKTTTTVEMATTTSVAPAPTTPELDSPGITQISAGGSHTCAVADSGTVKCWGGNSSGQLGNATNVDSSIPVEVVGLTGITQVSAGGSHTCAVADSGTVKCWGGNFHGQLGNATNADSSIPVEVVGLTGITQISADGLHTCAVTDSGTVKCWGGNFNGQLGNATNADSSIPVEVVGLTGITQISDTCALAGSGTVKCWAGKNYYASEPDPSGEGEILSPSPSGSAVPVEVGGVSDISQISASGFMRCALAKNGSTTCWGWKYRAHLIAPVIMVDALPPAEVLGLSRVTQIDTGNGFGTTCASTDSGAVKCWGVNQFGQLGDGTYMYSSMPVDVVGMSGSIQVSVGGTQACALTDAGAVKCWGANQFGQLGDGTTDPSATPVDVVGLS